MGKKFFNLFISKPARGSYLFGLILAGSLLVVSCVNITAATDLNLPYKRYGNLVYVENNPHERHVLDLYLPTERQNDETFPVLFWIHGGSWNIGNKYGIPAGMRNFAIANRMAFVSMNYRYTSHALAPAQIHDAKTAIRFLRANADRYNLDTTNIIASGFSAGGFLASYLGLTPGNPEFEGSELGYSEYSSSVNSITTFAVPFDLSNISEWDGIYNILGLSWRQLVWLLTRCQSVSECPEEVQRYSLINYVSMQSPSFYIQHGSLDLIIPISQSYKMCNKLRSVGAECQIDVLTNTFHDALVTDKWKAFVLEQITLAPQVRDTLSAIPSTKS